MGPFRPAAAVMVVLALCAALTASPASVTDRQARTVLLPPERSLTVDITIGSVRIEGSARTDAEIAIERQAPSVEALNRLPVEIEETDARVRVACVQRDGATDAALRTDVVLRVPREAVIDGVRVLEGRVEVSRFQGRLTADVRRGPIDGHDVSGILRLETGIGSVALDRARLSAGGLLRLRAFNGDVRLTLAERPADARILALALNGHIRSDIPLTARDSWGPRWSETTLGRGEPVISLDVVTGAIEIRSP